MADPTFVTDYLGQRAPVSLSGTPALPVAGAPFAAAAGPTLPAGAGVAVPGGGIDGAVGGAVAGEAAGAGAGTGAASQLGGGDVNPLTALTGIAKIANQLRKFFPSDTGVGSFELSPETQAAWDAYEASTGAGVGNSLAGFGLPETLGQVSGGELALGAEGAAGAAGAGAGAFGAGVAPSFAALNAAMGTAGPIWAGLTAAVDFLGEGKFPFEDILNSMFHFDDPSAAWQSYPGRLVDTLQATEKANQGLATALATAPDAATIERAIADWRGAIGQHVGDFASRATGPMDLPTPPGATGGTSRGPKSHQAGITADFSPEVAGLREMLSAAMAGATPEDRIAALMRGLEGRKSELAAEKTARDAEWTRIYGTPEEQNQAMILSGTGGGGGGDGGGA